MAKKQFTLAKLKLDQDTQTTAELFFNADREMNLWIFGTKEGKWCKKNAVDITYRVNYETKNEHPTVEILGRLEEENYTLYVLKFGGNK